MTDEDGVTQMDGAAARSSRVCSTDSVRRWLGRAHMLAEEYYSAPYRAAIARAQRDEEDLFMLLVFSEMMGLPNPVTYYTLELQPLLLERFHDWHTRMGMERSPLDRLRCC